MKKFIIILVISFAVLPAQEEEKKNEETPQPLELPNFIIEGTEQMNVKSGIKEMPEKTDPLTKVELDSLNSLEKQRSLSLPLSKLPKTALSYDYPPGYLKGSIGRFTNLNLEAGYGLNKKGYELFGSGNLDLASGHIDDAGYGKGNIRLGSDYIAPKKYFIFGGSRTRTTFDLGFQDYNLYGLNELITADSSFAMGRNSVSMKLNVDVDGNYEGVQFKTGGGFSTLQLNSENVYYGEKNAFDNSIHGFVNVKNIWRNFLVSGNADLDFRNVNGEAANFSQLNASAEYFTDLFSINVNLGFQYAVSSTDIDRGGLLLSGEIEYRMSEMLTIGGGIESGLEKENLRGLYRQNPYMMINSDIDFPYNIMKIKGRINYHPHEDFGFAVIGDLSVKDRYPFFDDSLNGEFAVNYAKVNIAGLKAETYWNITETDYLTADLDINLASFDLGDKDVPYIPMMQAGAGYRKMLFEGFGTEIGLSYVGERYSDRENNITVDPYLNLSAELNYEITNKLRIFLLADNLTNSDIYVWNNYKERSLFLSVGCMWQF